MSTKTQEALRTERALKLALEALEEIHPGNMTPIAEDAWKKAITAIRSVLNEHGEALAEKPAQQQEPVAWMWRCKPYCNWPEWSVSLKRPADSGRDGHKRTEGYEDVPLYTFPPASKPWVGLTQQDIDIAFDDTQEGGGFNEFARAIEAKLREKNAPQQSKEDA